MEVLKPPCYIIRYTRLLREFLLPIRAGVRHFEGFIMYLQSRKGEILCISPVYGPDLCRLSHPKQMLNQVFGTERGSVRRQFLLLEDGGTYNSTGVELY